MFASLVVASLVSFRPPVVIPPPEKLTCRTNVEVRLDATQTVTVACPDAAAAPWVAAHARQWFGVTPKMAVKEVARTATPEGYRVEARPDGILLEAKTLQGVRYALYTLRQVAERDSVGERVTAYRLPETTVEDSPSLAFRGIHLCWFPEQSADLIEREIRTAAFYKFNHVVLESWGVYRSERYPWFGWKDGPMTGAEVRRLVSVARDLGVTLIPQFNVYGHAAAARSCTGKHAALDVHPERQSLFEPGGNLSSSWNWCLSNPAAVEVVRNLVVELHEAFGNPPYFHIGCDEADEPTCASCRAADGGRLAGDHIAGICKLLRRRGARAMLWHDMLIERGDARWKGFYANGSAATASLAKRLPKDAVVCDWYYGSDSSGTEPEAGRSSLTGTYPTLEYFSGECGFDTLTCPWEESNGILAQAKYAREKGLFGLLETTWHHFGGERFPQMVQTAACGAWGRGVKIVLGHFSTAWRQSGWDLPRQDYRDSGWYDTQTSRDIQRR